MWLSSEELDEFIKVARGHRPADLILRNVRLVNVLSEEIQGTDVAIFKGRVAGLGEYQGKEEIDLRGCYLTPGFIVGYGIDYAERYRHLPEIYRVELKDN